MAAAPPQLNGRGFPLKKKPGPAKGCIARKTPYELKIESAEQYVQAWVRSYDHPVTGCHVQDKMIKRLVEVEGITDYYLVKHGVGSDEASSWLKKFSDRMGIDLRNQVSRVRTRRNGEDLREELFKCYRRVQAAMVALKGDSTEEVECVYLNADETGLWAMRQPKVCVARDQKAERELQLARNELGDRTSVLVSLTSDREFQVEPLILLHRFRPDWREVL
eukprot:g19512.t1